MTQSITTTALIEFTTVDPATGEMATIGSAEMPVTGSAITLSVDGAEVGDLRVVADHAGRTSIALGQFDRRVNNWVAQPLVTRRGTWLDQNEDGRWVPVRDGRTFPGLRFDTEAEAQIALKAIEAVTA